MDGPFHSFARQLGAEFTDAEASDVRKAAAWQKEALDTLAEVEQTSPPRAVEKVACDRLNLNSAPVL